MWWNPGFHIVPVTVLPLGKCHTPFKAVTFLGRHPTHILGLCYKGGSGNGMIKIGPHSWSATVIFHQIFVTVLHRRVVSSATIPWRRKSRLVAARLLTQGLCLQSTAAEWLHNLLHCMFSVMPHVSHPSRNQVGINVKPRVPY